MYVGTQKQHNHNDVGCNKGNSFDILSDLDNHNIQYNTPINTFHATGDTSHSHVNAGVEKLGKNILKKVPRTMFS